MNKYFLTLFLLFSITQPLLANTISDNPEHVKKITAEYQVKASFFALPIKARISVERLEPAVYVASVKLKSPFFKVVQSEKARISQCSLELLAVDSIGDRVGAKSWNEHVEIKWPEKLVSYQDGGELFPEYESEFMPTGFVSLFAHQYISFYKERSKETLTYTQSRKGWRIDYENAGMDKITNDKYFGKPVDGVRYIIPREDLKKDDVPSVWYVPERLGAFPVLMAMKLGVFHIDVKLKSLSADEQEIIDFFNDWSC